MQYHADVELFATSSCGWCLAAERLLVSKGVPYRKEDVGGNPVRRKWLRERTGRNTVPQILINGRPIGGYTDLAALESTGRLDELLRRPPPP